METEEKREEENLVGEEKEKKSNIFINICILLVIFIVSLFMYAKYIGTSGITVKEYRIKSKLMPSNFSGVKIIYFSDLLYGSTVFMEDVQNLRDSINELKPDIILFGGGLVSNDYKISKKDKQALGEVLSSMDATLGKYSVSGAGDDILFDELMNLGGFSILDNNYELVYYEDNTPICLVGIGSYNLGKYDFNKAFLFYNSRPDCYTIMITHEGDIIDNVLELEHKPNVIFTGNSLGGEISLPFYGPLKVFPGSTKYYLDYYEIDGTEVYVSSGIGTKEYHMRFNNRPSYNFFRLKYSN